MRLLAELIRDRDDPVLRHLLIETLAAQVVANAAYHHYFLEDPVMVARMVYRVAGYPMTDRVDPSETKTIAEAVVERVQAILNAA